jgi:two-component system, NtrC family, C4-dicarboxylate transport response regulator DctD
MPHVLIIDDEPTILTTLTRFFGREGWDVTACADATEALAVVTRADRPSFTLVLCDARLPGTSGMEFHQTLRGIAPALADRLVMITGDPFGTPMPVTSSGALPMLAKPFEFDVLRQLMRERSSQPGH